MNNKHQIIQEILQIIIFLLIFSCISLSCIEIMLISSLQR